MPNLPLSLTKRIELKLYRLLLRLLPRTFRERYEYELLQAFRDQQLDAPSFSQKVSLWIAALRDLTGNAVLERVQQWKDREFKSHNTRLAWTIFFVLGITLSHTVSQQAFSLLKKVTEATLGHFYFSADIEYLVRGATLGLIQWVYVKQYFRATIGWPLVTALAYAAGANASGDVMNWLRPSLTSLLPFYPGLLVEIPGLLLVLCQALFLGGLQAALLPARGQKFSWVVTNLLAGVMGQLITFTLPLKIHSSAAFRLFFTGDRPLPIGGIIENLGLFFAGLILSLGLQLQVMGTKANDEVAAEQWEHAVQSS